MQQKLSVVESKKRESERKNEGGLRLKSFSLAEMRSKITFLEQKVGRLETENTELKKVNFMLFSFALEIKI